jgi:cysteine sulfinate desulfinase/cysteine desulfurase-like protein
MGVAPDVALGAVRLSLGYDSAPLDIEAAADDLYVAYSTTKDTKAGSDFRE